MEVLRSGEERVGGGVEVIDSRHFAALWRRAKLKEVREDKEVEKKKGVGKDPPPTRISLYLNSRNGFPHKENVPYSDL